MVGRRSLFGLLKLRRCAILDHYQVSINQEDLEALDLSCCQKQISHAMIYHYPLQNVKGTV